MSRLSIQRGVNSLFFPGGTRSRSGEIESSVKLGLLGTAVEAQRSMAQENTGKKVFMVPMVICYNSVLEAPFLIEQHLKFTGKENYIRLKDEGTSVRAWLRFIWRFFSTTSDITLSIGKPLDVLGNFVDAQGRSFDKNQNELDIREYFISQNQVNEDRQREEEYTKILAARIEERYLAENVVLSSHLVAYAVFEMLRHENPKLDIFGILRLPQDEYIFPRKAIKEIIEQLQTRLFLLEKQEKIRLDPEIFLDAPSILKNGIQNLGIFHTEKPLVFNKDGNIISTNFRVLYFYHNRLQHYHLDRFVQWKMEEIEVLKFD
jgi:glycerol-3-phosphate O-acyltransferase